MGARCHTPGGLLVARKKTTAEAPYAVTMIALDALRPFESNARQHSPAQVAELAKSIERFGFATPVLVESDGTVVAGHGRIEAAKLLGLDRVPAIRLDHLTADEARALRLADNRLAQLATWDDTMLAQELKSLLELDVQLDGLGWNGDELEAMFAEQAGDDAPADADETLEDDFDTGEEAPLQAAVTKPGDVWMLGRHRLLCGDSTSLADVARLMGTDRADCVFTSPPYAVGIDYGPGFTDDIDTLRAMLPKLARLWFDVLVDGGFAVINFGDIVSGRAAANTEDVCEYPMALEYWPRFRAAGFALWSRRVWIKPIARVAAPWTSTTNRSATNFEHVWTWKKPGEPIVGRIGQPMDSSTGVLDTTRGAGVEVGKDQHGAGMPKMLAEWMVRVHSRDAGIVLEPFCGTGTTLVACEQLGRACRAADRSPEYVELAVRRWERFTGQTAELVRAGA